MRFLTAATGWLHRQEGEEATHSQSSQLTPAPSRLPFICPQACCMVFLLLSTQNLMLSSQHDAATGTLYFRAPGGATAQNDANCINCCPPCGPGSKPGGVMQPFRVNPSYYFTEVSLSKRLCLLLPYSRVPDVSMSKPKSPIETELGPL